MAGFSVFQPTLGAALQWLPALGTPELDEMIHAVLPGPASIQEKRTSISIDFFEYSQQTGENFKYYPVPVSFAPTTVPSPASSAGLYDSAYGSNFNVSPVISNNMSPWPQSPATFASSFEEPKTTSRTAPSKKPSASSSRQTTVDFANHPGMRIMTKDGRDVTNSASRGCKTKEQRDHAHLMRIIKACDSCKRKKVRCDPSHRKRAASSAASQTEPKAVKKAKKKATESPPAPPIIMPDFFAPSIFETPEAASSSSSFESSPESVEDLWTQFVIFDQEPLSLVDDFTTDDYSFFNDPQILLTPGSTDSSTSPSQWCTAPYTPAPPGPSPSVVVSESLPSNLVSPTVIPTDNGLADDLIVPYLNPGVPHGTNYADFNLFSPPRDFFLDEEPLPAKKALMSGRSRLQSPQPTIAHSDSPTQLSVSPASAAFAHSDGYYVSPPLVSPDGDKPQSALGGLEENRHSPAAATRSPVDDWVCASTSANVTNALAPSGAHSLRHPQSIPQPLTSSTGVHGLTTANTVQHSDYYYGCVTAPTPDLVVQSRPSQGTPTTEPHAHHSNAKSTPPSSTQQPSMTLARDKLPTPSGSIGVTQTPRSHVLTQPHAPTWSATIQQCSTEPSPMAVAAQSSAAGATSQPTVLPKLGASPVPGERPGASAYSVGSGTQLPMAVLAASLVATLPMQRILGGRYQRDGRLMSSAVLFQLAVFGLVSSLLAIALQTQSLGHEADSHIILNLFIIASMSCASLLQRGSMLSEMSPELVGMPASIDNVKTKIQVAGQRISGLRCAVSQQLRALIPRLPSLATVKF